MRFYILDIVKHPANDHRTWSAHRRLVIDRALRRHLPPDPNGGPYVGVGAVGNWDTRTLVECERPGPVQDQVLASNWRSTVSDRFKRLLEDLAGTDLQFLPVIPHHKGKVLDVGPYWVVNPLRQLDCLHCQRSGVGMRHYMGVKQVSPFPSSKFSDEVIVPRLVPPDANAFSARFARTNDLFFKEHIYRAATRAGLVGVFWMPHRTSGDPDRHRRYFGKPKPPIRIAGARHYSGLPPAGRRLKTVQQRLAALRASQLAVMSYLGPIAGASKAQEARIGGCAAPTRVTRLERWIGRRLPRSYREMLRTCGTLDLEGCDIFGIAGADYEHLDARRATAAVRAIKEMRWPRHMLVVGDDGRGGDYCLDLSRTSGDECPVVYHDHERDAIDENSGKITPSFEPETPTFTGWLRRIARTGSMF